MNDMLDLKSALEASPLDPSRAYYSVHSSSPSSFPSHILPQGCGQRRSCTIAAAKPACSELAAGHGLANAVAYEYESRSCKKTKAVCCTHQELSIDVLHLRKR